MSGVNGGVVKEEPLSDFSYTGINSITYGTSDSTEEESSIEAASANFFYGEKSDLQKRQHIDASVPENQTALLHFSDFQTQVKVVKKRQKKIEKKAKPQPLVRMINEVTGAYDKSISIRQILK